MSNEQAPECCPFCGAALGCIASGKPAIGEDRDWARFECGTYWYREYENQREDQTPICIIAERERLTRERDDLATRATALAVQVDELTRELEAHAHDLSPAMVQARNDQLAAENTDLLARVKRLGEAGDALIRDNDDMANIIRWHNAKEAKP